MRRSKIVRDDDDDEEEEYDDNETNKINETSEEEEEEEEPARKKSKIIDRKVPKHIQLNKDYRKDSESGNNNIIINANNDNDDDDSEEEDGERYELLPFTSSQIVVNKEGFRRGSIVRARFEHFVTYDFVEILPGPFLNVILGPNGTGKSSIACGIALGLATRPQVLGRAKDPKDYIKRGFDSAAIEIELCAADYDNKSNLVIRREIMRNGPSKFMLNGKVVAAREVARRCSELRIQIDNLCQFLPQDKVAEFAGLTPCQLLEETEKAIGHENMLKFHKSLISMQAEERDLERKVEAKRVLVGDLKQQNERLKSEVDKFNKRAKMKKDLEKLVARRHWMRFEAMRKEALGYREALEKAKGEYRRAQQKYTDLETSYKEFDRNVKRIRSESSILRAQEQETDKAVAKSRSKLSGFYQIEMNAREEIKRGRKRAEDRDKEIKKYKDTIIKAQLEMQEFKKIEADEKENEIRSREMGQKVVEIQAEIDTYGSKISIEKKNLERYIDEVKKINSRERRVLNAIETKDSDAFTAYEWLTRNKNMFKDEIYGPIALHVFIYLL